MSKLISGLLDCIDSALSVREQLGADKRKVYIVTRQWSGRERGDGDYVETVSEVRPTPGLKDLSHSWRVSEGGAVEQGDMFITHISKNLFPREVDVDCSTEDSRTEKFYRVGTFDYRVISVVEKQVTWDVQVRRLSAQNENTDWRSA